MQINKTNYAQKSTAASFVKKNQVEGDPAGPKDGVDIGNSVQQDEPLKKKWTFLHYGAGDNNLDRYIQGDVKEMESVGSDANTNIVAILDHTQGKGAKTYYITKDNSPNPGTELTSPVLETHGVINMADPNVFADFVIKNMKKYPAEHYMVDIGDHGGGWSGAISDDSSGGWMDTPKIGQALAKIYQETGQKIDILGFDCCLMATTEVAHELAPYVNYMVASEESEGGLGWNYNDVLKDGRGETVAPQRNSYKNILMSKEVLGGMQRALRQKIDLEPKEFAMKLIDAAELHQGDLPTMSATDLSKMGEVAKSASDLAKQLIATDTPNATLKGLARKTQSFSGKKDFYHFAQLISEDATITDEKLKEAAKGVMGTIGTAVIAEEHASPRYKDAHGLTIEIPSWGNVSGDYDDLAFNKDVPEWKESMNKMSRTEVQDAINYINDLDI